MEADVQHLLIAEVDHMIARAQLRVEQHGTHIGTLQGHARRQRQLALQNVQRTLERLRSYRQALATERLPGCAPALNPAAQGQRHSLRNQRQPGAGSLRAR